MNKWLINNLEIRPESISRSMKTRWAQGGFGAYAPGVVVRIRRVTTRLSAVAYPETASYPIPVGNVAIRK